jgi:hypothetical protein
MITPRRQMESGSIDSHFFTSALFGGESSGSHLASLPTRGIGLGTNWVGGWMYSIASLEDMEKEKFLTLPGLEL